MEKNRDSDKQSGPKKGFSSPISPHRLSSEIPASKYVHMFVCKAEYVEQYFMSLFTIVAQAAVKEFYVVSNASFSRREFFRCLISVTGNILCAI